MIDIGNSGDKIANDNKLKLVEIKFMIRNEAARKRH